MTNTSKLMSTIATTTQSNNNDIISLENHHYDICNCINVSFIPRQIMSASNFIQVRFKTVPRTTNNLNYYRGYLIRYKFITSNFHFYLFINISFIYVSNVYRLWY
jgi:hypothetical protein